VLLRDPARANTITLSHTLKRRCLTVKDGPLADQLITHTHKYTEAAFDKKQRDAAPGLKNIFISGLNTSHTRITKAAVAFGRVDFYIF
jgi:hypothetical protein